MSVGVLVVLMETDVGGACHTGNVAPQRAEQNYSKEGSGFIRFCAGLTVLSWWWRCGFPRALKEVDTSFSVFCGLFSLPWSTAKDIISCSCGLGWAGRRPHPAPSLNPLSCPVPPFADVEMEMTGCKDKRGHAVL